MGYRLVAGWPADRLVLVPHPVGASINGHSGYPAESPSHQDKHKAQYISLKNLLCEKRSKRVKQVDKVKKLLLRLKGRRWRDIALLGLILAVDLLDLATVDAQAALGQDMQCHFVPQTLA